MITTSTIKAAIAALRLRADWYVARSKPTPFGLAGALYELEQEQERRTSGAAYAGLHRFDLTDKGREALRHALRIIEEVRQPSSHAKPLAVLRLLVGEQQACCDCGTTTEERSACPLCGRVFCRPCAEKPGEYASCCDMP